MGDFHRMENAEFSGIPIEPQFDRDAITYLSLKELAEFQNGSLGAAAKAVIAERKRRWRTEQFPV